MACESVGSCTPVEAHQPGRFREEVPRSSSENHQRGGGGRGGGGDCYFCHQRGHWFRDCPSRITNRKPEKSSQGAGMVGSDFPEWLCPCGAGPCLVLISKTERNPGRKFYKCPARLIDENCNFFLWCDEAAHVQKRDHGVAKPQPLYPSCACGAGRCRLLTKDDGEDKGRKYFACPVKRGHGACNFFQWYDTLGKGREMNDNRSKESISVSSHVPSEESRETSKLDGGEKKDGSRLEGMLSDQNVWPTSKVHQVEEDGCYDQLVRKQVTLPVGLVKNVPPLSSTERVTDEERFDQLVRKQVTLPVGSVKNIPPLSSTERVTDEERSNQLVRKQVTSPAGSVKDVPPSSPAEQLKDEERFDLLVKNQVTLPVGSVKNIPLLSSTERVTDEHQLVTLPVGSGKNIPPLSSTERVTDEERSDQLVTLPVGSVKNIPPLSSTERVTDEERSDQLVTLPVGSVKIIPPLSSTERVTDEERSDQLVTLPVGSVKNLPPLSSTEQLKDEERSDQLAKNQLTLPAESESVNNKPPLSSIEQLKDEEWSDQLAKKQLTLPAESKSVKNVPPLSSTEQRNDEEQSDQLAPIEAPSVHAGKSPSAALKSKKYFSCGIGHWMIQCIRYPTSPCCWCGKTGHQKKVCEVCGA